MSISLNSSVQYLKSIGPKKAELFPIIGVTTTHNLIHFCNYKNRPIEI